MNRRDFLQQTSRTAMTIPFLKLPGFFRVLRMGIVVHSYAQRWNSKVESKAYPGFANAIELIEHCHQLGAGGVQVMVRNWSGDFAKKVRDRRENLGLYFEGSIALPKNKEACSIFEADVIAAKEAGATILRAVCLSGRRYESFHSREAFEDFRKNSIASLQWAEPIVRKHQMKLALENHKDWRAPELVEIMKQLSSEWIGVTLDFGNNIALVEDPMDTARALAPYAFSTHVKDMGVEEYKDGFLLSEVPLGGGYLDLKMICDICRKHNPAITFNLEMITRDPLRIPCLTDDYWSTFADVRGHDLAHTLRAVRENTHKSGLMAVSHLSNEQRLATEEENIVTSLQYSKAALEMN